MKTLKIRIFDEYNNIINSINSMETIGDDRTGFDAGAKRILKLWNEGICNTQIKRGTHVTIHVDGKRAGYARDGED